MPADAKALRSIVVADVKAYLGDPTHWCQCANARDKDSKPIDTMKDGAVSFCLRSGVWRSAFNLVDEHGLEAALEAGRTVVGEIETMVAGSVLGWNDDHRRTHPEVVALLDRLAA